MEERNRPWNNVLQLWPDLGRTRAKGNVVLSSVFYPLQVELFEAETMKKESIPSLHMSSFLQSEVCRRWSTLGCTDVCVCVCVCVCRDGVWTI